MHHHAVPTIPVGQDLESQLKSRGHCLAPNEVLVQWLRLQTHMDWFPHPLQTYESCLTTFICCGREYGSITMLLLPHLLVQIWEVYQNPWSLLGAALNEALVQWLRLQTHMEWFPHPLQTYTSCLTTFICCGWGYGSIIMPLQPHLSVQIWEIS